MRTLALLLVLLSAAPSVAQDILPPVPKPTPSQPIADAPWLAQKKQRLQQLFQQRHELLQHIQQMKSQPSGPPK